MVQYPPGFTPEYLELEPSLTAKRLVTHPTFRDLFRSTTVAGDKGLGIKDITFLFTDLKGSTALYEGIGDTQAYFLVRQHFELLNAAVARHDGAIVKTIGDAIMATFSHPEHALQAALEMLAGMDAFNATVSSPLHLKIGIHRGHSVAVTLNERLDFFGQTVNIAARVQGLADADEIWITDAALRSFDSAALLAGCRCDPQHASVKGVSEALPVHRIMRLGK